MTASKPEISVIIPVLGERTTLESCLEQLRAQDLPKDRYEVLVVDNGSEPPLDPSSHGLALRLSREPTPGSYVARNHGLSNAEGDVLSFTDVDCMPDPGWLVAGVAALASLEGPGIIAGKIELYARNPAKPTAAEAFELQYGFDQQEYVEQRHYGATANLFVSREVFDEVGPFDARLRSSGDKEWGQRAVRAGFPIAYESDAVIRHPARHTLPELWRKHRRVRGGHLLMRELGLTDPVEGASDASSRLRDRVLGLVLVAPLGLVARSVWRGEVRNVRTIAKLTVAAMVIAAARGYETLRFGVGGQPLR